MERDLAYYERKMLELQRENEQLRDRLNTSSRVLPQVSPEAIQELQSKNERLVREAQKYEESIKGDLSLYISQASTQRECYYRSRYTHLLNAPKNHYKLYF